LIDQFFLFGRDVSWGTATMHGNVYFIWIVLKVPKQDFFKTS